MYLGVQVSSVRVGGAGDKALIGGWDVEGVEVGVDGFRNGQDQREEPDERRTQDNTGSAAGRLDV